MNIIRKLWVDSTSMAFMSSLLDSGKDLEKLNNLIDDGYTLVVSNSFVDISVFQKNPLWVEDKLRRREIFIEMLTSFEEMTSKPFFWSSRQVETKACTSFEEAIKSLKDYNEIEELLKIAVFYGFPKGYWEEGPCNASPHLLDSLEKISKLIGLNITATRTEIFKKALARNMQTEYDIYNSLYIKYLAIQHCCDGIVTSLGEAKKL